MLVSLEFIKEYVFCDCLICLPKCFPSGSDGKYYASNSGDPGSIPGSILEDLLEKGMATYSSSIFFFPFIFISWRLMTLHYCSGFCHALT